MKHLSLFALLLASLPLFAQRDAKTPDPDPELERKTFILPEGFEVNLWAADPLLAKPIQMNFDSKGRLWIAASEVYPQIKPGQKANDKILILEDTTGKGVADKTTVFADGLLIPTGVEPDNKGGAYVADSTDLVYFSDPGKDGKATKKRIVLSGFGTEDTHHILHTLRHGPDGLLYMSQSIYIHSHIETPHGVKRLNAGGIWQFRPETEKLEVFARGWWNSWGTAWDKNGATFATDGAGGQGINYVVPGAWYEAAKDPPRILPGLNPGSPKYCGLEIVSGRHLPDDWQQNLITNDFRGHRVCRYIVQEDGSGFVAKEQKELIKSNHPAFRPIDVKMGPDGAIYIADWYNPIIQHGEVDFRDERRDKTHGRIWRITAKGRPLVEKPKIDGATGEELMKLLNAPEDWTRSHAKRELLTKGRAEVMQLLSKQLDSGFSEPQLLEALWLAQAVDEPFPKLLAMTLKAKEHSIRASACRVAGEWADRLKNPLEILAPLAKDENPRVRLEAVRALAKVPGSTSTIASALDQPVDKWLDYAIWQSLRETKDQWLPDVKSGKFDFGGDPKKLVFALRAAGENDVAKPLKTLLAKANITPNQKSQALKALAELGGTAEMVFILDLLKDDSATATNVLPAVEQSIRIRKLPPPKGEQLHSVEEALFKLGPPSEGALLLSAFQIAGSWKVTAPLEVFIAAEKQRTRPTPGANMAAYFEAWTRIGGEPAKKTIRQWATDPKGTHRALAVAVLVQVDPKEAAAFAVEDFAKNLGDPEPIFAAFVNRKGGSAELVKALGDTALSADVAKIGIRVAKSNGQADPALVAALTKAGKLSETKRSFTKPELDTFLAKVKTDGDPKRGEMVYRRGELNCLKCHGIAGSGGQVGPDMTSIGASAQADYLVESLLNPNAKIKEGYNAIVVTTADDRVFSGIKIRETGAELVLRDAEGKEVAISKADKPEIKPGKSLMPDGLIDSLTAQEFMDLIRFLTELGKGEYLAQPGRYVRTFETVQPSTELFSSVQRDTIRAVATNSKLSWAPVYATVSGHLPAADIAPWKIGDGPMQGAVRFQLDCTTGGKIALAGEVLTHNSWIDGVLLKPAKVVELDLKPGKHTVVVSALLIRKEDSFQIELVESKDSPARVQIVGGR